MAKFSQLSLERLATCDVRLQVILNKVIEHIDFAVVEGHRGEAAQEAAFKLRRSDKHWPNGNHNSSPSRAVDIAPFVNGMIQWSDLVAFGRLMGYVQAIADIHEVRLRFGLDWNGDFLTVGVDKKEHLLDAPHLELLDL